VELEGWEDAAMSDPRIERMRDMVRQFPEDPRGRYFLAHELFRQGAWSEAAEEYACYLRLQPRDEGMGYLNFGICLERDGRADQAREVYQQGIAAAVAHHHEGLAAEIRERLNSLGGPGA
jgi:Tfp pilus assembly protein PilF